MMLRFIATSARVALLLVAVLAPQAALANNSMCESHVWVNDETQDAYVWVTVYHPSGGFEGNTAAGSWCVAPGQRDQHGLKTDVYETRVEVMRGSCSGRPIFLDARRGFPTCSPANGRYKQTMTYWVRKTGTDTYAFGNY